MRRRRSRSRYYQPDMGAPMAILVVIVCLAMCMAIFISDRDSRRNGEQPEQARAQRSDDMDTLPAIMAGSLSIP